MTTKQNDSSKSTSKNSESIPSTKKATTEKCTADTKIFKGKCYPEHYYDYVDLNLFYTEHKYCVDSMVLNKPKKDKKKKNEA